MSEIEERRKQLREAIAEQWEHELRESPEFATRIGDYRYNDLWSDLSLAHLERQKTDTKHWLARFEAIDTAGFPEQEILDHRLMLRNLRDRLAEFEFKTHEMPVDQLDGVQLGLADFVANIPFESVEHYEQYLARLKAFPRLIDQVIELLEQGQRDGLMPPRYLLEKTVGQCRSIAGPPGETNVFGQCARRVPESVPASERERLRAAVISAVDRQVRPAYVKLADFIAGKYAPNGRVEPGVWSLPDGEDRYRFMVRLWTTTELDPRTIHELGIEEVARIETEQTAIARELGFPDLKECRRAVKGDPDFMPTSRQQILDTYRHYIDQMMPRLPELFGLLPTTGLEIRPVQEYREKEAAAAEYNPGTPDGSRPGIVYLNTGDYEQRSLVRAESTAYHEAVPGHHMQTAIAQTLPDLPAFRQHAFFGAYIEGWALYSERLGKDIGFYQDPRSDFGRLSDELLRAVRLVLDTGVHHKRWTREQMIDYFHEHSSEDELDIQAETDRYIVSPAQALSYKLGQLQILDLRRKAQDELGSGYDVRAFHDTILDGGALPLDLLESRVNAWINERKTRAAG